MSKNEMPLTEQDFAEIRRNVMREIGRRSHPGRWVALAAAAVIGFVLLMVPREDVQVPNAAPVRTVAPQIEAPAILPATPARSPARPRTTRRHTRTQQQASSTPVRMEFQTADPDVRIIWIAQ